VVLRVQPNKKSEKGLFPVRLLITFSHPLLYHRSITLATELLESNFKSWSLDKFRSPTSIMRHCNRSEFTTTSHMSSRQLWWDSRSTGYHPQQTILRQSAWGYTEWRKVYPVSTYDELATGSWESPHCELKWEIPVMLIAGTSA
jgi:hypothetical protein